MILYATDRKINRRTLSNIRDIIIEIYYGNSDSYNLHVYELGKWRHNLGNNPIEI
jgi:hypothetical protein